MSIKYISHAFDAKVGNPLRKLILIKLCDNANDSGECWPSLNRIAEQCEISRRSVISHIQELEKLGVLSISHRANASSVYSISLRNLIALTGSAGDAPPHRDTGAGAAPPPVQELHPPSAGAAPQNCARGAGAAPKPSLLEPSVEPSSESSPSPVPGAAKKKGTRLPNDWRPTREYLDAAILINREYGTTYSDEWFRRTAHRFRDYWVAKTGKDATKADWLATWRNWVRRDLENNPTTRARAQHAQRDIADDDTSWANGLFGATEPSSQSCQPDFSVIEGDFSRVDASHNYP